MRASSIGLLVLASIATVVSPASAAAEPVDALGPRQLAWESQLPGLIALEALSDGSGSAWRVQYHAATDTLIVPNGVGFLVVDATTFEVVHEGGGPTVNAIDLSDDGTVLAVVSNSTLIRYRTSDWARISTQHIDFGLHVEIAPGSSATSLVRFNGLVSVVRSGAAPSVTPVPSDSNQTRAATWGVDANTVVLSVDDKLVEYDVSTGTPTVTRERPLPVPIPNDFSLRPLYRIGDLIYSDWGFALDPRTFEVVETFTLDTRVWGRVGHGAIIRQTGTDIRFTQADGGTLRFRMPKNYGQNTSAFMLPLDGARFAYLEAGKSLAIGDAEVLASPLGDFTPTPPRRIYDTRVTTARSAAARMQPGERRTVQVAGVAGVPSSGVAAAVVNLTAVDATAPTFVSVFPSGTADPTVSNVNVDANLAGSGLAVANLATVALGSDGRLTLLNGPGAVDVALDLVGYYADIDGPAGSRYVPLDAPRRLADTRVATGGLGATFGPATTRRLDLSETRVAHPSMTAAVLQVTAVGSTAPSFITLSPSGSDRPEASNLNLIPGRVTSNLTIVPIGSDASVNLYNFAGDVEVAIDLVGLYEERSHDVPDQGGRFLAFDPARIFDSRGAGPGGAPPAPVSAGAGVVFTNSEVNSQVRILDRDEEWTFILNLTAVLPTEPGFLAAVPDDSTSPTWPAITTSNVNFGPGEVRSNQAYVTARPDWTVFNSHGDTHVIVDVFGTVTPNDPVTIAPPWA